MIDPNKELMKWGPVDGRPIYLDAVTDGFLGLPQYLGIGFPDFFYYVKDDKVTFVLDYPELWKTGQKIFRTIVMDTKRLQKEFKLWLAVTEKIKEQEQIINKGLSKMSDAQLIDLFLRCEETHTEFWLKGFLPELANYGAEELLKNKIIAFNKTNFLEIFELLATPEDRSYTQNEELELLIIKLVKDKKRQEKLLQQHQKKYYWLHNSYGFSKVLGVEFFRERIEKITETQAREKIKEIKEQVRTVKQKKQMLQKKYKIPNDILVMAKKIVFCVWWQDLRKSFICIENHIISQFVAEVSKRKKIPFDDLCYYSYAEFKQLLKSNRKADLSQRRSGMVVYYHENKGMEIRFGKEAEDFTRPYLAVKVDTSQKELNGLVVSKGKTPIVRGVVKVLFTPRDLHKFNEGEVLVTVMTTPDYVPLMQKACAIITDEGGMTSHAAIVSRELGVPCVVRTKIATKLLKDGDRVEINTQNGVIKVIKDNSAQDIYFEKMYTRDSSAIIQQAWYNTLNEHIRVFGGDPMTLTTIHYLHDGVIEVWDNVAFYQWVKDRLLERNKQGPAFFDAEMKNYAVLLSKLKPYYDAGVGKTVADLKKIIDLVFEAMVKFDYMYFSSMDDRTPSAIRAKAMKMRDKDTFFDQSDRLIRNSLIALYPVLEKYENAVLRKEISNPPKKAVLQERHKHFVFMGEKIAEVGALEEFAKRHSEYKFKFETLPKGTLNEVKGSIAYKGVVRGVVRILKRKDQISSVKEGDIIVSPMTTPDYLPAMQRAAAFVTDEGGITCHAAIIARELKKPCIIGTKVATQVFKDGERVEVDATKGVVKKIK